jgi:thiamine pyrophosphokinase
MKVFSRPGLCSAALIGINIDMFPDIVQSLSPVTLLGGGEVALADLRAALVQAPLLVAADGGANMALSAGLMPDAVIGDLDSLTETSRRALPAERLHLIPEQESTDFEKCLTRISAPYVLGLGFTGARVDHLLAVWNALVRHPGRRCLILGRDDVAFAAPRALRLDLTPGTRISLFPMVPLAGSSRGLLWPIDGLEMSPGGRIGTSNQATGPVDLAFDSEGMLVILPRSDLPAAIAALR